MNTVSFGRSLSKNPSTFAAVEPKKVFKSGGIYENRSFQEAENDKHLF